MGMGMNVYIVLYCGMYIWHVIGRLGWERALSSVFDILARMECPSRCLLILRLISCSNTFIKARVCETD